MSGAACYDDKVKCPGCECEYVCETVVIYSDKDREVTRHQCPNCKDKKTRRRK